MPITAGALQCPLLAPDSIHNTHSPTGIGQLWLQNQISFVNHAWRIEPFQFAGSSLSRDLGKGSKFPLVCSLVNCLLPSNRSKNTKHLHNRPMLIVFNSLARKYLLGKGNQNTLKTTIIGGNYPVRNIVCSCTVHCTALCY